MIQATTAKDIFWQNKIYVGVPDGESRYNYPNYEVLNAPVDWIDGKDVTGLYELQHQWYSHTNKMWGNCTEEEYNCVAQDIAKCIVAIPLPASSGEKEEQEVKEDMIPVGENIHTIKTWDEYMMDIASGKKTFEVRKNDRNYEVEDKLILQGFDNTNKKYTGKWIIADVVYILHGGQFGIEEGYCVMGIKVINYNF